MIPTGKVNSSVGKYGSKKWFPHTAARLQGCSERYPYDPNFCGKRSSLNRIAKFTVLASLAFLTITPTIASSVFALVQQNAYVNSAHQFSINPPNSWSTDATGSFGTVVIFYGPTES